MGACRTAAARDVAKAGPAGRVCSTGTGTAPRHQQAADARARDGRVLGWRRRRTRAVRRSSRAVAPMINSLGPIADVEAVDQRGRLLIAGYAVKRFSASLSPRERRERESCPTRRSSSSLGALRARARAPPLHAQRSKRPEFWGEAAKPSRIAPWGLLFIDPRRWLATREKWHVAVGQDVHRVLAGAALGQDAVAHQLLKAPLHGAQRWGVGLERLDDRRAATVAESLEHLVEPRVQLVGRGHGPGDRSLGPLFTDASRDVREDDEMAQKLSASRRQKRRASH